MRKTLSILLCATLFVATPLLAQAASKPQAKQQVSSLFVLSAEQGDLVQKGNTYQLTLKQVHPRVLWFSDRPVRKAGHISTSSFIQHWSTNFASSAPNGALVSADMSAKFKGKDQSEAMTLGQPTLHKNGNLTLSIKDLNGDQLTPGSLTDVSIFIDNISGPPGPINW